MNLDDVKALNCEDPPPPFITSPMKWSPPHSSVGGEWGECGGKCMGKCAGENFFAHFHAFLHSFEMFDFRFCR